MNPTEISILYLSIGSAVGAHSFFKSDRSVRQRRRVRTKVMAVVLLWPVYLLILFFQKLAGLFPKSIFVEPSQSDSSDSQKLILLQKRLESMIDSDIGTNDLYAWREVLTRYAGLSLSSAYPAAAIRPGLLSLGSSASASTQQICLNRRNRERLLKHRNGARTDFLRTYARLLESADDPEKAGRTALEFAKLLKDDEAVSEIDFMLTGLKQTLRAIPVDQLENRTWIPQRQ